MNFRPLHLRTVWEADDYFGLALFVALDDNLILIDRSSKVDKSCIV